MPLSSMESSNKELSPKKRLAAAAAAAAAAADAAVASAAVAAAAAAAVADSDVDSDDDSDDNFDDNSDDAWEAPLKKRKTSNSGDVYSRLTPFEQNKIKIAKDFADSIMGHYEKIPKSKHIPTDERILENTSNRMFVLRNVIKLESEQRRDIVIRSTTEPFWQACLNTADTSTDDKSYRVCVVGTPGVGKTACTPILIRMLLKAKHTVVYLFRKNTQKQWYYEFIPDQASSTIKTKVYHEDNGEEVIASLMDPSTYYVVDPGMTKCNCCPETDFKPKVIIIASPDERHWGESEFDKERDGISGSFKYFPLWSFDELLNAGPFLGPKPPNEISKIVMEQHYRTFGGVPRHIFADEKCYRAALDKQRNALNVLTSHHSELIAMKKLNAVESKCTDQPKSALIGYQLSKNDLAKHLKGENILFDEKDVVVISSVVADIIYNKYIKMLWLTMLNPTFNGWMIFDIYVHNLLTAPEPCNFQGRACVGVEDFLYSRSEQFTLGGCTNVRQVRDIIAAAKNTPNVLFHSTDPKYPLIDCIYQDNWGNFHAFQATLAGKHKAKRNQIMVLQNKVDNQGQINLYYMVPGQNFEGFVTGPVNPCLSKAVTCNIWHVSVQDPNDVE
jgi:hypothetical protein